MLAKNNRLHKETEIKSLIQQGQTFFLPQFVIKYRKNTEKESRFTFVVSTKVDKKAIVRNRIKRQLRAAVQELLPQIIPGFDVIIIVKKSALDLEFSEIVKQLQFALSKIRVYKILNK